MQWRRRTRDRRIGTSKRATRGTPCRRYALWIRTVRWRGDQAPAWPESTTSRDARGVSSHLARASRPARSREGLARLSECAPICGSLVGQRRRAGRLGSDRPGRPSAAGSPHVADLDRCVRATARRPENPESLAATPRTRPGAEEAAISGMTEIPRSVAMRPRRAGTAAGRVGDARLGQRRPCPEVRVTRRAALAP